MKLFSYLAFSGFCMALFHLAGILFEAEDAVLGHEAAEPDLHLDNAKTYAMEHVYDRSLLHLDKAVKAIREIEQELDPKSRATIDHAIDKLDLIYYEIAHDSLNMDDLNRAFIRALNALTYAEIKVTEHYVESHELDKARIALKYGRLHLKNALKYAFGETRNYEISLYKELDSVIDEKKLSSQQIIDHLEDMLAKLDTIL